MSIKEGNNTTDNKEFFNGIIEELNLLYVSNAVARNIVNNLIMYYGIPELLDGVPEGYIEAQLAYLDDLLFNNSVDRFLLRVGELPEDYKEASGNH